MSNIKIVEVSSKKDFDAFVSFPNKLYRDCQYYVPSIRKEEEQILTAFSKPEFGGCIVKYWLAFKDNDIVGRIAGIINHSYINKWGKRFARFGWLDFIDDENVSAALIEKAEAWAISEGMEALNGPMGFTDFDPQGILFEGFDEMSTIVQRYNYPYYSRHLENLGFVKDADWIEYQIEVPKSIPVEISKSAAYLKNRYGLHVPKLTRKEEILPYLDDIFSILNEIYSLMYGFVPITEELKEFYVRKYVSYIDPRLIALVLDKDNKLIAFGITMPSMSPLFKKANGSALALKSYLLLGNYPKNKIVDMYFIGVKPSWLSRGLSAVLFDAIGTSLIEQQFEFAETNMEYESNEAVQSLWRRFEKRQHKKRRCYLKYFINSTRIEDNI